MRSLPRFSRLRRHVLASLLVATVVTAVLGAPIPGSAGEAPRILDVSPLPGMVTARGATTLGGLVVAETPISEVRLLVGGAAVPVEVSGEGTRRLVRAHVPLPAGSHVTVIEAELADGRRVERAWRHTVSPAAAIRIGGRSRTDTARLVAEHLTGEARAVAGVLARSDGFADALAGVGLAHAVGGPLLLSSPAGLDAPTRQALTATLERGATVHLLGGQQALGEEVEAEVRALGFDVRRSAGADRYATAAAVARASAAASGTEHATTVVVASGEDFADALAVAPLAATHGWPVVLVGSTHVPDATQELLDEHPVEQIELIGGTAAISSQVETALADQGRVVRTAGRTRYDTAARVAERFARSGDRVLLASGTDYADALAGGVAAARWDAPLLLTAAALPADTGAAVAGAAELVVLGGPAAVSDGAVRGALRAVADGGVPVVEGPAPHTRYVQEEPGHGFGQLRLRLPGQTLDDVSQASLLVGGREALLAVRTETDTLVMEVVHLPEDLPPDDEVAVSLVASLVGPQRTAHVEIPLVLDTHPPTIATREGYVAIASAGAVHGAGGPLRTFSLEVEPATGEDLFGYARQVEEVLADPRGWTGRGEVRFQRVEPAQARVRILLARPATVDRLCAGVANTAGRYSCWSGRFIALNLDRWRTGATHRFDAPLEVYRGYLVNHEMGHALGHGHVGCPAPGALAPVMMQQSKGTGECRPNAWPYP
jgi:hypothetical protein